MALRWASVLTHFLPEPSGDSCLELCRDILMNLEYWSLIRGKQDCAIANENPFDFDIVEIAPFQLDLNELLRTSKPLCTNQLLLMLMLFLTLVFGRTTKLSFEGGKGRRITRADRI